MCWLQKTRFQFALSRSVTLVHSFLLCSVYLEGFLLWGSNGAESLFKLPWAPEEKQVMNQTDNNIEKAESCLIYSCWSSVFICTEGNQLFRFVCLVCENNLSGFGRYSCRQSGTTVLYSSKSQSIRMHMKGKWADKKHGPSHPHSFSSDVPNFRPCPGMIFKLKRERENNPASTPDNLVNYCCDLMLVFPSWWWLIPCCAYTMYVYI